MSLSPFLIDPRMFTDLARDFYVSTCAIYTVATPLDSVGDGVPAAPVLLANHGTIRCYVARQRGTIQGQQQEQRRPDIVAYDQIQQHVMLDAYYPLITTSMIAIVDGVTYDIRGVVPVGSKDLTKLILELVQ